MTEAGGVVILTHRNPLEYALVNRLAARFAVRQVIYERHGTDTWLRLAARRARRVGAGKVAAQFAYTAWDRLVVRPRSRPAIQRMLAEYDTAPPGGALPQLDVDSINAPECARALEAARPAVVVVAGTTIIKAHILELAPLFLNVHAGITPRYRGAHGAFWAVWEGRPELAGVTVHVIDKGIDTGGIVAQAAIPLRPDDTPRTLAVRQTLAGLPLLIEAVEQALAGSLTTRPRPDLQSRLWHTPTPLAYIQFRRQLARLAREGKLAPAAGSQ